MSAQDKLDRRAAKHGLGSDERKRKIQKAKDFFSKPVPSFSKDELRKMGHPVESTAEYGKSMDRIRDKEKNAAIKPKDRDTLGKLADLMKKQKRNEAYRKPTQAEIDADKKKDGKSKDSSTRYRDIKKKMYGNAMGGLKRESSLEEKTQRLVFDTPSKASKAEKSAKRLNLKTDSESQGGNYYVAATGDNKNISKWVKMSESANLPAHLQGIIGKGGNIDAKKVKRDPVLNKNKTKVTDVTPKGYGPKEEEVDESTMRDRQVVRAMRIAKDMAGNHTGATKAIEKLKKGLSDHPKVRGALRTANESVATADKKPQNFRDPITGKLKVRMVPVDRDVVRGNDAAKSVAHKKRFKHLRKEQMATGNSHVGKSGRDAMQKAFKDMQKTADEIQKRKDADKK